MKVLLISASPVNKSIGIGNTFLNIIPEEVDLASLYTRNGLPDKRIKKAFCINEKMIINRLLGKSKGVGKQVTKRYGDILSKNSHGDVNKKIMHLAQKKHYTFMFWAQGLIWRINLWKSKELKEFIDDYNPDLIFTLFSNNIFLNRIILHILKISKKPLALYAWDNNYQWNKYQYSPFRQINHFFERKYMQKVMNKAEKLYVISDVQKDDYERIFHKPCTVLTKGADFSGEASYKENYNMPLQFIYTGNIGNNRWKSLALIADALAKINKKEIKGQLKIYTDTPLTKEMENALNKDKSSIIMGSVPAGDVPKIQSKADVLVHAESFERKNRFLVRQSFSTKIVDYFKLARPILVIGPKEIASVDYFIKNNVGIVITDKDDVIDKITYLIDNQNVISEIGKRLYDIGKKNHDIVRVHSVVKQDFKRLID